MKTLNWSLFTTITSLLLLTSSALTAQSNAAPTEEEVNTIKRPEHSDGPSLKLISNYLTASGGEAAHQAVLNVFASGTYKESSQLKYFKLVETHKGERHLTLSWTYQGRKYEEITVFDGVDCWTQELKPKEQPPKDFKGLDANHFKHQRWFIPPFTTPLSTRYDFQYQGNAKVAGRPAYLVVGFGPQDERSWFYFDKENFLITQYGGIGKLGRQAGYLDYRATKFKSVDGVFFPSEITLLAKDQAYGEIVVKELKTNVELGSKQFYKPQSKIPVLRSRPRQ